MDFVLMYSAFCLTSFGKSELWSVGWPSLTASATNLFRGKCTPTVTCPSLTSSALATYPRLGVLRTRAWVGREAWESWCTTCLNFGTNEGRCLRGWMLVEACMLARWLPVQRSWANDILSLEIARLQNYLRSDAPGPSGFCPQDSCSCWLSQSLCNWWKNSMLWTSFVNFRLADPNMQSCRSVDMHWICLNGATKCVVCHMKDLPGFSQDQRILRCRHRRISSQVIWYSSFALSTRSCCSLVSHGRPLGEKSFLNGGGIPHLVWVGLWMLCHKVVQNAHIHKRCCWWVLWHTSDDLG